MPYKLLAAGDIHLGRSSTYTGLRAEFSSTQITWNRLIERAIELNVDAVLLSGDIIDKDNKYFEARGPLVNGLERLADEKIQLFAVAGNHDYDVLPQVVEQINSKWMHLLGREGTWESRTLTIEENAPNIVGWSFPKEYYYEDPLEDFEQESNRNGGMTLGLIHGEFEVEQSRYGPLSKERLLYSDVDIWVLGHIHKPEMLNEENPTIFYPGSLQALNPKESGAHGAMLITVEGQSMTTEFLPLSNIRYDTIEVDSGGMDNEAQFRDQLISTIIDTVDTEKEEWKSVESYICDVNLVGSHPDPRVLDQWKEKASEFEQSVSSELTVKIRKVINEATPAVDDLERLAEQNDPVGLLARTILDIEHGRSNDMVQQMEEEWNRNLDKINSRFHRLRTEMEEENGVQYEECVKDECWRLLGHLLAQNR